MGPHISRRILNVFTVVNPADTNLSCSTHRPGSQQTTAAVGQSFLFFFYLFPSSWTLISRVENVENGAIFLLVPFRSTVWLTRQKGTNAAGAATLHDNHFIVGTYGRLRNAEIKRKPAENKSSKKNFRRPNFRYVATFKLPEYFASHKVRT